MIQKRMFSKCALGISHISGWGLFARENINKGDFIMEYIGEIVEEDETKERDKWNCIEEITYIFTLNNLVKKIFNLFSLILIQNIWEIS